MNSIKEKLTARERIETLLDKGSFVEMDKHVVHRCTDFGMEKKRVDGDGVISGYGKIDGRIVFVYAFDFAVMGGSLSAANAQKIAKVQDLALKNGAPIIGINDSGGARIQEGVESLTGFAHIFGPDVVRAVTNENVDKETLGGAMTHNSVSGVSHFICKDDEETLLTIRELIGFIPSNNMEDAPVQGVSDDVMRVCHELDDVVPTDPNMPYDIRNIIEPICDQQYFFEIQPQFAQNIVIGFGRLAGRTIGFVANQPNHLAGALDIDASDKAARFIRFCDCFNIPLVAIEDVPGFLPGVDQEHHGIIRHGAKIVYAFAEATVPKVTLITRKAYGGAYIVMNSKCIGADVNLAYPTAEIAVMGAEGACNILYRKETPEVKKERVAEYREKFANPLPAARLGYIDEIISPCDTRIRLIQSLEMCRNKNQSNPPKKHGNMPL